MSDRRAVFFLIAAVLAGVLVFVAEPEHRWVAAVTSITYVILAIASALDAYGRSKR